MALCLHDYSVFYFFFFFSSRRRHTRFDCDWSSDVCSSDLCRATALAATRLGMQSRLLLRTADPARPPATTGNILLDRLAGADIRWVTPAEYARRYDLYEEEAEALRAAGRRPYIIPEGGSNAVGSWGYVVCCEELVADLRALPLEPTTIVH